jgi:hypothetical protein
MIVSLTIIFFLVFFILNIYKLYVLQRRYSNSDPSNKEVKELELYEQPKPTRK